MSDTPRTDEYERQLPDNSLIVGRTIGMVPASFARDLERQLAAEREARAYAEKKEADLFAEVTAQQYRADTAEERLAEAVAVVTLAYEAMNYLGDILNSHDMAEPEDEAKTGEAFRAARAFLSESTARQEEKW